MFCLINSKKKSSSKFFFEIFPKIKNPEIDYSKRTLYYKKPCHTLFSLLHSFVAQKNFFEIFPKIKNPEIDCSKHRQCFAFQIQIECNHWLSIYSEDIADNHQLLLQLLEIGEKNLEISQSVSHFHPTHKCF